MIWSFLLAFGSMFGMWLVPKRPRLGWAWSLGMEVPWTIWGIWLEQWGFVMLSAMFAGVYAKNLRQAVRETATEDPLAVYPRGKDGKGPLRHT